jgi:tRNA G10  N-methylase Trm11
LEEKHRELIKKEIKKIREHDKEKIQKLKEKYENLEKYKSLVSKNDFDFKNIESFKSIIKKEGFENNDFDYDDYLKPIWNQFEKPKVDLKNPKLNLFFLDLSGEGLFFGKEIFENKKEYLKRMPKLRPIKKPYTLKSDLARICINMLNVKKGDTILDPFAGIGGILLEGFDMNLNVIANDINWNDLNDLYVNFEYFFKDKLNDNAESFLIRTLCDASKKFIQNNSIDGIITDIPYGKSSRIVGTKLYEDFLKNSYDYLKPKKRLVVVYANFIEFEKIALKYFKKLKKIDQYINKSLTRHILVLEKE